jgi:hypothetical protein
MSKNDTLSQISVSGRMAIHAFKKLGSDGQKTIRAMLASGVSEMNVDRDNTMTFSPVKPKNRNKSVLAALAELANLDFRVLLGLMRAGFGEMPKQATEADAKERYRSFWIPEEVWKLLQEIKDHLVQG